MVTCSLESLKMSSKKKETRMKKEIFCSDTGSQIAPFSRECFLRHHEGQLKTAVKEEAGEKID